MKTQLSTSGPVNFALSPGNITEYEELFYVLTRIIRKYASKHWSHREGFSENFYKSSNKFQEGLWCVQGHMQCDVTLG